jgi:hypothetical protein
MDLPRRPGLAATVAVTFWVTRIARKALKEQDVT